MRLGNDIVDLNFVDDHHTRFAQRILSPIEIDRFPDASQNPSLLWSLWAAKESAYKAMRQTAKIGFHHREFQVAADCQSIQYFEESLALKITQDGALIFALATDVPMTDVRSLFARFEHEPLPKDQSSIASNLLIELASQSLAIDPEELSIIHQDRIPKIQRQGKLLKLPASCTHHGRFIAASLGTHVFV
ncbi:MAG: 4'-phosphopantetheinyl transferase superfamily protein [Proteobacteria bacterium]|nr:4'-phosphopantetheinyl transferase superfamily protein [Pseudomonadota bacterium]